MSHSRFALICFEKIETVNNAPEKKLKSFRKLEFCLENFWKKKFNHLKKIHFLARNSKIS